jgi:hypothetical protein
MRQLTPLPTSRGHDLIDGIGLASAGGFQQSREFSHLMELAGAQARTQYRVVAVSPGRSRKSGRDDNKTGVRASNSHTDPIARAGGVVLRQTKIGWPFTRLDAWGCS